MDIKINRLSIEHYEDPLTYDMEIEIDTDITSPISVHIHSNSDNADQARYYVLSEDLSDGIKAKICDALANIEDMLIKNFNT